MLHQDNPQIVPDFGLCRVPLNRAAQQLFGLAQTAQPQIGSAQTRQDFRIHSAAVNGRAVEGADRKLVLARGDKAEIAPSGSVSRPTTGQYDWFWAKISPDASDSGPGRLEKAMSTLSASSSRVPAPRL